MFDFETAEQKDIRGTVRKLAQDVLPNYASDKHLNTVPQGLLSECGKLGLCGLSVSEAFGGISADAITTSVVMEELSYGDLGPAIWLSVHSMVSGLISKYGSPDQQKRYLPRLASGEILGAFALTEPTAGSDAAAITSTAIKKGSSYILSGEKCYITSAGFAGLYILFAKTSPELGSKGISAFIVEAGTPGLTIGKPEHKMGCELSPIGSLSYDQMVVPESALLGAQNEGFGVALSGLAGGRVNIAACANGISAKAIDLAVKATKERKQFGARIIDQQGIQFILADMKIKLEAARLLTWQAAMTLSGKASGQDSKANPSIAKCFATDSAMQITTDAVQLLGGAGYLKDYIVEKLMRDAKMLQIVEGTNQIQRLLIARSLDLSSERV